MTITASRNEYVASLPMILDEVVVRSVERIAPSYVRVSLGGPCVGEIGVDGPLFDQRIKLVFPAAGGDLPSLEGMDDSWWETWLQIPEDERGSIRTYTIRDLLPGETGATTGPGAEGALMVVDIVVHEPADHSGPGNRWALGASVGDRLITLAPRRGHDFGGIEWSPGDATRLLLVGDETALPAIRGILRDLPDDAVGAAFVEVPESGDILGDVRVPSGMGMTWLPRNGSARGEALHAAVIEHLTGARSELVGLDPDEIGPHEIGPHEIGPDEIDPDLWETPVYSSSGEAVAESTTVPTGAVPHAGLYAWIAGESKVVTGLRRKLVNDLGLDRAQVAFMGYWREGVAMRS